MDAKISPNFSGAGVLSGVSSSMGGRERNKSVTRPRTAIYDARTGVSLLPCRKKEATGL